MTTPIDLPTGPVPQWAVDIRNALYYASGNVGYSDIVARLIWKYVPEPVSPELQAAREAQDTFSGTSAPAHQIAAYAIERFKELEGRGNG